MDLRSHGVGHTTDALQRLGHARVALTMLNHHQSVQIVQIGVFLAVLLFQWRAGAFQAEFAGHPDEAAHYVSGVMVSEYLRQGAPAPPLEFAEDYYLHYPKVAIGHWPPFFYALQGGWMLVFSPARLSIMALMAILAAVVAALIYQFVLSEVGLTAALWATLIWLLSPATQQSLIRVMPEILTALLCFGAVLLYVRYLKRPGHAWALAFGVAASLALLTSGIAIGLALLPPLALLLGRQVRLIRRGHFWAPLLVTCLLAAPWYLAMHRLGIGTRSTFTRAFEMRRLTPPATRLWGAARSYGVWLMPLALMGLALKAARPDGFGRWAALGAVTIAGSITYAVLPESEEPRHACYLLPPLVCFAADGVAELARRLESWIRVRHAEAVLFVVTAAIFTFSSTPLASKQSFRLAPVVEKLQSDPSLARGPVLVSSSGSGEGPIIAEAAIREPKPGRIFLRASKLLADSTWGGRHYRLRYQTEQEINDLLQSVPVAVVVLEGSRMANRPPHHRLLQEALDVDPWKPVDLGSSVRHGSLRVFRLEDWSAKPRSGVRLDLRNRIGKILTTDGDHIP